MLRKNPVAFENSQPRSIAETYRRTWTGSDVETTMAFVVDDVSYRAPGISLRGKSEYRQFINSFALQLTGLVDIANFTDGSQVTLFCLPQIAAANATPVAECFTTEEGKVVDSVLIFDRLSFAPPTDRA